MSKHKHYDSFYNPQTKEEEKVDVSYDTEKTEEVASEAEEATEEKMEDIKASAEEIKPNEYFAIVTGAKQVNMRTETSKDAPVMKVLSEGTKVTVIYRTADGVWSKIVSDSITGFMMTKYLKRV